VTGRFRRKKFLVLVGVMLAAIVLATAAPANAPTVTEESVTFDNIDPCSGAIDTITFDITVARHEHDGRVVEHNWLVITTSSGYVGRGEEEEIVNGEKFSIVARDMLTNPNGNKIQARLTLQVDLKTFEVRRDELVLRCVRS
jgi:hypothetical protein